METWARLLSILWLIGGVSGFQWSGSDSGPIQVCSGHSIELLWNFTLDRGERVKRTVWRYQVEGGSEDTLATCVDGHLVPSSNFSGRLALHKDGGIELSCATILESGNYSVFVSVEQRDSSETRQYNKTTTVKVVDTPKTQSGEIHVTTKAEAVRDVTTGAWHVHLACGIFSDLGHPPVDVIWTTPRGEQLESSGYEDGVFLLVLANPVLEGNYSCRIAPALPAAHCLPPHSPLHNTEVVQVEAAAARITVMEAQQRELVDTIVQMKDTMAAERREKNAKAAERRKMKNAKVLERRKMKNAMAEMNDTMAEMNDTMAEMNNTMAEMNETMAEMINAMAEMNNTMAEMNNTMAEMNTTMAEMNNTMAADRREMDKRTSHLQKHIDTIQGNSVPVSFHAKLGTPVQLSKGSILKLTEVITNQGGGYNSATGKFTAPVSGTFFFVGTAQPTSDGEVIHMSVVKEGVGISFAYVNSHGDFYTMGSCHGVVEMEAGERVWLESRGDSHFSWYTFFSGFRID